MPRGNIRIRDKCARRGLDFDLVTHAHVTNQPSGEQPAWNFADSDAWLLADGCTDRIRASLFLAVDDPAQRERLPGSEGELLLQRCGDVESHRCCVVTDSLDRGDPHSLELLVPQRFRRCGRRIRSMRRGHVRFPSYGRTARDNRSSGATTCTTSHRTPRSARYW